MLLPGPVLSALVFTGLKLHSSFQTKKRSHFSITDWHRRGLLLAGTTVICGHLAHLYDASIRTESAVPQQVVVSHMSSILMSVCLLVSLVEGTNSDRRVIIGSWSAMLLVEAGTCLQAGVGSRHESSFFGTHPRLAWLRLTILTIPIAANAYSWSVISAQTAKPLVASSSQHDSKSLEATSSDSEDDEKEAALRAQREERRQAAGSWFAYVAEYKIFLPMLWPFHDRKVQFCLVMTAVQLSLARALGVLVPRQLGIVTDALAGAATSGGTAPWKPIVIWMALTFAQSHIVNGVLKEWLSLPVTQHTYKALSTTTFSHILNMSMDFHDNNDSGELSRTLELGYGLQAMLDFLFFDLMPMLVDSIVVFIAVPQLFDAYMVLIVVTAGVVYYWAGKRMTRWSRRYRKSYRAAFEDHQKVQYDSLSNVQTILQFNKAEYESRRYKGEIERYQKTEWDYTLASRATGEVQDLVMLFARLLVTAVVMYRVSQGTIAIGSLISFMAYWRTIERPLSELSWMIEKIDSMLMDSERLLQLLQTKPTVVDSPETKVLEIGNGKVEFTDVDFAYDARKPIIKDMSFVAEPGSTCALVGETGGGKTTALKLLFRYYDVIGGVIRIDGQDIRSVKLDSLRDCFGMVTQAPALFNTTIMENLRYARVEATDEEIFKACRDAAIHDKIVQFPDGYNSTVGERGVKLSGGELQRIAIARAILRDPKIVLLDEATSQIDAETEAQIQKALKKLAAGRTTFVIAHRISTVQHADQILVIGEGTIVERGTHEELIQAGGKYAALWARQTSKEAER